jgi:hypothetical protein
MRWPAGVLAILGAAILGTLSGCSADPTSNPRKAEFEASRQALQGGGSTKVEIQSDPINDLWKEGYGFGNSNAQRVKDGEKPLNMNGKVDP